MDCLGVPLFHSKAMNFKQPPEASPKPALKLREKKSGTSFYSHLFWPNWQPPDSLNVLHVVFMWKQTPPKKEVRAPGWLFRVYVGDEVHYTVMWRLYHNPWNKDPVIKQPGFNGKYPAVFFFRGSHGLKKKLNVRPGGVFNPSFTLR